MLDWFPDRRGLASGLVIAGFGSGALAFTPLVQNLCGRWADIKRCTLSLALVRLAKTPSFLGSELTTSLGPGGELLANVGGEFQEVLVKQTPPQSQSSLGCSLHLC